MEILGIIIVIFTGTLVGFYYSFKPIYRKNDLLEMKRAILILNSEIKFLNMALNEILISIEKALEKPVKDIFTNFKINIEQKKGEDLYIIWQESLQQANFTYFTKQDIEKFFLIGKSIGFYDKELNYNNLNLILNYIEEEIKSLEEYKNKNSKMFQSLGILGSLALVILLI